MGDVFWSVYVDDVQVYQYIAPPAPEGRTLQDLLGTALSVAFQAGRSVERVEWCGKEGTELCRG